MDKKTGEVEGKKVKQIPQYKVGDKIYEDEIAKKYFFDSSKEYIIFQNTLGEIKHYGKEHIPQATAFLLAQCNSLMGLVRNRKMCERVNYDKAFAINEALLGNVESSEKILKESIERIKQSEVVWKKICYIGIYLLSVVLMLLLMLILPYAQPELYEKYQQYLKIATFGSLGGFISLNIRLKKVEFEISETTWSYVVVSVYKMVFAIVSSLISYFLVEAELVFTAFKDVSANYIYLEYTVAALAGFSESLLPNIFSGFAKGTGTEQSK